MACAVSAEAAMQVGQSCIHHNEVPVIPGCGSGGCQHKNPHSLALARDPLLMSVIEQSFPLRRGDFFNRDCEKVDGKAS